MIELKLPADAPRVKPLKPHQVNSSVLAEYEKTIRTWGISNNLIRTMAAMPQLALTEVDYANAFIFDTDRFVSWPRPGSTDETVQFPAAGFIDRVIKELVINLVSLLNRSRYSITHHTFIGFVTLRQTCGDTHAEQMLLHLVNDSGDACFRSAPAGTYTELQLACMELAETIQKTTGHAVTDASIIRLRSLMATNARLEIANFSTKAGSAQPLPSDDSYVSAYVDGMLVELTWCICHFGGLLNKWFTVMKVRDEEYCIAGGKSFIDNYNVTVPESIKRRNNALLGANGWGSS